jgi:hypothetical protein
MGTASLPEPQVDSNQPGELSFEAMMNPPVRLPTEAPAAPARSAPPGLPPLPPGANPTAGGEEDAA